MFRPLAVGHHPVITLALEAKCRSVAGFEGDNRDFLIAAQQVRRRVDEIIEMTGHHDVAGTVFEVNDEGLDGAAGVAGVGGGLRLV